MIEKETAMQIEDKVVLNNLPDAISVATQKQKLAPSVMFQTKTANIIENLNSFKNLRSILILIILKLLKT